MVGNLILSLYEVCGRYRLSVIMPDLLVKHPLIVHGNAEFLQKREKAQEWASLIKLVTKKFGLSRSIPDLTTLVRKMVDGKDDSSPHIRRVLITQHRVFLVSKILPDKLGCVFNCRNIVRNAIKASCLEQNSNPANTCNMKLLKQAFPEEHKKVLRDLTIIISSD